MSTEEKTNEVVVADIFSDPLFLAGRQCLKDKSYDSAIEFFNSLIEQK